MSQHEKIEQLKAALQHLSPDDVKFASSFVTQAGRGKVLSDKQLHWVQVMIDRAKEKASGVPEFDVRVGDFSGVIELFKKATQSGLRRPKIRLQMTVSGVAYPLALTVAGAGSKRPGTVNVTNGGPYDDNVWYGRVNPDGRWEPSKSVSDRLMLDLVELLERLAKDPAGTAAEFGKLTGACSFCSTPLSDPRSLAVGYGEICSKRYSLPWG